MTELEALEAEIWKLPAIDRAHLLQRLIESLEAEPEVEKASEQVADRREAELDAGSVSGDEALKRLRSRLLR